MSPQRPDLPDDEEEDALPTEEHTIIEEFADGVLTDDDIDDSVKTVERRLPPGLFEQKLPRFEMTGTITLPRDFVAAPEPVTLRQNPPPPVAPPARVTPPPKPARPSLRAWVTPPPKPARPFSAVRTDLSDFAPTPVRPLPDLGPPPLPPPAAPRAPSIPPPLPPPARAVRSPSLPASLPPPAPRAPSLPPPAPVPRAPSLPPQPRMPSAPDFAPAYAEPPAPAPRQPKKKSRPRPPEPARVNKSDATRPFPLQAPRAERSSAAEAYATPRPEPSPSHTPPPLTASTPPPAFVGEVPVHAPQAQQFHSEPPPRYPSAPPLARVSEPLPHRERSRVAELMTRLGVPAATRDELTRLLRLPNSKALSAAIGVFAALVVGMLVIMIAATLRENPNDEPPPASPVVAARPLTSRATLPIPIGTPAVTNAAPRVAPTPGPGATSLGGCRLVTVPRRIAGPAMPNVLPMGAPAPGQSRVAVGYASGKNHAEGVIVNLDDLSVESRYSEEHTGPVFRITPLADRAPVAFAVDRDDPRIQNLRTIPASPPLRIGTSYFGLVRLNETTTPTVIWPGARFEGISEPSFAVTERDGYGIAFRTGRGSGDVLAGWLTPSGTADGDLGRIDAGAREVGAPSMAASDRSVVVAFAARASGEPWHIRVAMAARGKVPSASRELIPAQSGAPDAISPVIVALSSGGFLMQWLEGPSGGRRVMARTLDEKLTPQGVPIELAQGAGVQDSPGALIFRSGKVLAVHFAATDKSVEIRAAVLVCG